MIVLSASMYSLYAGRVWHSSFKWLCGNSNNRNHWLNWFHILLYMNGRNSVFAQEILRRLKWQICDYLKKIQVYILSFFFCFIFHSHRPLAGQQVKGMDHPNFSVSLPPACKDADTSMQFFNLDDQLIFLISAHIFSRLPLQEIYLPLGINIWLNDWLIVFIRYCSSIFDKQ